MTLTHPNCQQNCKYADFDDIVKEIQRISTEERTLIKDVITAVKIVLVRAATSASPNGHSPLLDNTVALHNFIAIYKFKEAKGNQTLLTLLIMFEVFFFIHLLFQLSDISERIIKVSPTNAEIMKQYTQRFNIYLIPNP